MSEAIFYVVLVGGASLLGMIAGSYGFAICLDRFCSSPYAMTERVFSRVSNEADLMGMATQEREIVLERLFQNKKTVRKYHQTKEHNKNHPKNINDHRSQQQEGIEMVDMKETSTKRVDLEIGMNGAPDVEEPKKSALKSDDVNSSDTSIIEAKDDNSVEEHMEQVMEKAREINPDRLDSMCSICLVEYGTSLVSTVQ
jgi:hypothetical protein